MMVLQIVRVIRHPMCEETIREVASKPNHSNLFSLWIREEVPGLGRFPPLDTNQTLLEQLTGSVHVSMPHMIVEGFTSFVNFFQRDESRYDQKQAESSEKRQCGSCGCGRSREDYSNSQWRKRCASVSL